MACIRTLPIVFAPFFPALKTTARNLCWVSVFLGFSCTHSFGQPIQTIQLRVVGGLDRVNQYTKHEQPFWTVTLPTKTRGRVTAEIVPFDKSGFRASEVLGLVSSGVVQIGTILAGASAAEMPELGVMDLAGVSPDISTLRNAVESFRPILAERLRQDKGVELLAIYAYPGQVVFCREPFNALSDLRARRIRTATSSQSDFVEAFGGIPVRTPFDEIPQNLTQRNVDCAITGSMSGNTLGIHRLTSHVHSLPISWGLSVALANKEFWAQLPADVRRQLSTDLLPALESKIWEAAKREFNEGIECNVGSTGCLTGDKGRMVLVRSSEGDQKMRKEIFQQFVLHRWLQRCGESCRALWNTHFKKLVGDTQPSR